MAELARILVVKLADLGDLLTATPALRALRYRYPTSEITALVTPHSAALLAGNDALDHVITFPKALFDHPFASPSPSIAWSALQRSSELTRRLRAGQFDAVVLLHHLYTPFGRKKYRMLLAATGASIRVGLGDAEFLTEHARDTGFGGRHEVDYWLDVVRRIGAEHPYPRLELHLTSEEHAIGRARWGGLGIHGRPAVAIHPGSGAFSIARRWPAERYAALGDALTADGYPVVLVAGPGEEPLVERVRAAMQTLPLILREVGEPRQLAAALSNARLFVGNDSGVTHLAAAVGVPCVAVFGLSNERAWGPYPPERHRIVRLDLACSPCLYHGAELGTPQGCAARSCLMDLPVTLVLDAVQDLLAAS